MSPYRGGDERVRTDDPLLAKQVLSQLSYTPVSFDPASIQLFSSYSPEGRALKIKQRLKQLFSELTGFQSFDLVSIERR